MPEEINAEYRPNLEIFHDDSDRPGLRDTDSGDETLVRDIGTGSGGGPDTVFGSGHTFWKADVTDSEIRRFEIPSGTTLTLEDVQYQERGGGTEDTSVSVDVVDASTSTTLASANLNTFTSSTAESSDGATIIIQRTNTSGADVEADITVRGSIQ